jgi:hypothetical protein
MHTKNLHKSAELQSCIYITKYISWAQEVSEFRVGYILTKETLFQPWWIQQTSWRSVWTPQGWSWMCYNWHILGERLTWPLTFSELPTLKKYHNSEFNVSVRMEYQITSYVIVLWCWNILWQLKLIIGLHSLVWRHSLCLSYMTHNSWETCHLLIVFLISHLW